MHNQLDTLARQHLADMRRVAERDQLGRRAMLDARPASAMPAAEREPRRAMRVGRPGLAVFRGIARRVASVGLAAAPVKVGGAAVKDRKGDD